MAALWLKLRAVPGWLWPLAAGAVLLVVPLLGMSYAITRQIELTLILALIVVGLNLSLGYAGELAMGQVAMYAAGAYTAGMVSKAGVTELWVQLLAGAAVALVVGLISGIPGLRLGSWSLAMTSFFLIILLPDVLSIFKAQTGGRNGLAGIQPPTMFGEPISGDTYYVILVVITILIFAMVRNLIVSRHGSALRVLKQSPVLASSMGISVFRAKLTAYAIGALPAGLAGVLFANLDLFISPEAFAFSFAMTILAASIFGGSASIYGAIVGAAVLQFGMNQSTNFQQFGLIIAGAFLLLGGVAFTGGLSGLMRALVRRADAAAHVKVGTVRPQPVPAEIGKLDGALLRTDQVSKAFGGNQALSEVSVEAKPGAVTAIIGPNGSGKTTLLNMISGFYRADSGTISIDGEAVQGLPAYKVARAGVSRTFQTPNVPEKLTVLEAVEAGRYAGTRASILASILRLPSFWRTHRVDRAEAERALALVGLTDQRDQMADSLPLGNRRLLEVARSLVAAPKVLLLDEVASGLDEDELDVLESLILRLRDAGMTVILVEHNFQLVLRMADEIYVLAQGAVMAHGTPAEIERNTRVMEEYLGVTADHNAHTGGGDE
ncbi:branched-chain amino acid ABC transporter ATP-binding protein/permease [Microbacterium sp. zg.Y1090]|uniref:branched-chain amino acid ABC transporter ATP-binding protein/permease n=1 Tax=Microbacterium wangruii TaxID=3049073 RepID=UPI00214DBC42|nr:MULTISPECIES: branched-chain amino acid ABC transporter ATP-binding protein/permease [unclassified Microbacterium]MCR2819852.1 branched-chain amino acid ABC transporter ATP-binding protein/permease [Microbacterium sp. zg.Y1090]MDL5487963.1 branched-chain amino acid ABC transporter ATP-binding protein/permease [Microbacterium sp. zg-Y1211]WIM28591.1 branched-chain amino acid ABC transporter ATP-binding protein/permease [Microbacterium sp. zg-Y1090]